MMKLSLMKKVVETVDSEWKSTLAEEIIQHWDYDDHSVYYWRASANFIFVGRKEGKRIFLRFNSINEREFEQLDSEMTLINYLSSQNLDVAKPILSKNSRYIEKVETSLGTFYASLFEGLEGEQLEIKNLTNEQFYTWGSALGRLHEVTKMKNEKDVIERPTWRDHAEFIKRHVPLEMQKETNILIEELDALPVTNDNFGIIHFDYELDNLYWDNNNVSMLDFDDSSYYWYVADIAYALRDLDDLSGDSFNAFINGYKSETSVDERVLNKLSVFIRFHELFTYARVKRAVDIKASDENPEWLNGLIEKLNSKLLQGKN